MKIKSIEELKILQQKYAPSLAIRITDEQNKSLAGLYTSIINSVKKEGANE